MNSARERPTGTSVSYAASLSAFCYASRSRYSFIKDAISEALGMPELPMESSGQFWLINLCS